MSLALRLLEGGPLLIERGSTQTLTVEVGSAESRERIAITSGTVSLLDTAGVALVTTAAVAPSTSGRATYSLLSTAVPATLPLGRGYRLVWVLVVAGTTYTLERDASLCRRAPSPTVTAEDLYARHPDLRDQVPVSQISVGWQPQIDSAWREIVQRLDARGRRHELVWSVGSVHDVHLARTFEIIYRAHLTRMADGSRYERLADGYREDYRKAWDELVFAYDPDDTGLIGKVQAANPILMSHGGPRTSGLRGLSWWGQG